MPSTAADRSRRYRAHRAGDHSLCDPSRCDVASRDAITAGQGTVATALEGFLTELTFPEGDPRACISVVARRLAEGIDAAEGDPPGVLVRELRLYMRNLMEAPNQAPSVIDEIRARRASRRVGALLSHPHGLADAEETAW